MLFLSTFCHIAKKNLTHPGQHVPLASFIGSILSSRDHQMLLTGALQLVELLHELAAIADQELSTKAKADTPFNTQMPEEGSAPPMPPGGLCRSG
jgi:hypothetical protein